MWTNVTMTNCRFSTPSLQELFVSFCWSKPNGAAGFGDLIAEDVPKPVTIEAINEIRETAAKKHEGTVSILWWKLIDK